MIQTINVMEVYTKEILFPGEPSILLLTYPFEEYLFNLPHTSHGEKTLKVQDGSMDLFSGSILQLIFWKLPAVEFGCCIKEKYQLSKKKKAIYILLLFQLYICERADYKFQMKQHITRDCRSRENPAVFIKPDVKDIYRNIKQYYSSH